MTLEYLLVCPDSPFQALTLIILTFNSLPFPSPFPSPNRLEPRAFFELLRKRKKKSAVCKQLFILLARNLEMLYKNPCKLEQKVSTLVNGKVHEILLATFLERVLALM